MFNNTPKNERFPLKTVKTVTTLKSVSAAAAGLKSGGSDEEFEYIRDIVYKLSRISLGPSKKTMVLSRITRRMRILGCATVKDYCALLKQSSGRAELSSLVDVISTNHTYFFRESPHFDYLTQTLLASRAGANTRPFKVWSTACSSGEEPYSIAMMLMEQSRIQRGFNWSMEATDISSIVLEKAKAATYAKPIVSRVPEVLAKRYFQVDPSGESYRVNADLVKKIRFHQLNLFEIPSSFPTGFDLIVCRNVMIYFDRPTREQLISMLIQRLLPGGTLFVGHSESLSGFKHDLEMVKPAIYVKAS
jgi:chemotaxis protein methyltransferase CheR